MTHILKSGWNSFWNGAISTVGMNTSYPQKQQQNDVPPTNKRELKAYLVQQQGPLIDITIDGTTTRSTRLAVREQLFDYSSLHYRPASLTAYVSIVLPSVDNVVVWYNSESTEQQNDIASAICDTVIHGPILFTGTKDISGLYTSIEKKTVQQLINSHKIEQQQKKEAFSGSSDEEEEVKLDLAPEFNKPKRKSSRITRSRRPSPTRVKRIKFKDPPKIRKSSRIAKRRKAGKIKSFKR